MADSDSLDYLQPGFNPNSMVVARLRSVLVAHNIKYPSNAKKSQLVEIFNDELVPKAKKILDRRIQAKRSSMGITDADQGQSSAFEEHDDLPPPPPAASTRRSRSPRKASMRIKSEEPEHLPLPAVTSKKTSRASSRQLRTASPEEDVAQDTLPARRVRKAKEAQTPQLKTEDSTDTFFRRESGAFSTDNPFQSGSSPSEEKPATNRRRTTGHDSSRPTTGSSPRRQTDFVAEAEEGGSALMDRFQALANQHARGKTPEQFPGPIVEAGEEFTPEEQLELAAEEVLSGQSEVLPAWQTRQPRRTNWVPSLSVMLVAVLTVYGGWFRQEKVAVGYCGVGRDASSIPSSIPIPDWVPEWAQEILGTEIEVPPSIAETIGPKCEVCPPHATCFADFTVQCDPDYLLRPHPLSLWGAVPLPPTCEPDGEKVRRIQVVADRAMEELRERTAKYECGNLINEAGERAKSPAIEEEDLKAIISSKRSKKMSPAEFEDLWAAALGEIASRDEVQTEVKARGNSGTISTTYSSTSLARIPLSCAVPRYFRLGLARYRLQISTLIALVISSLYGWGRFKQDRKAAAQVPALVDVVLERLANQQQQADEDEDPWLFLPNLRDDVLRSIHSLGQREALWKRVRAVVEQNSNVRTGQREGQNGEVGRAWEWVGPLPGDGVRRRRSGRASLGPPESAIKSETGTPGSEDRSHLHQKWEEARPIY